MTYTEEKNKMGNPSIFKKAKEEKQEPWKRWVFQKEAQS